MTELEVLWISVETRVTAWPSWEEEIVDHLL